MSTLTVGVVGFVVMFALIMVRMPVALAMLAVGGAGYAYFSGVPNMLRFLNATPYYPVLQRYVIRDPALRPHGSLRGEVGPRTRPLYRL